VPLLHCESSLFFHNTDGASPLRFMAPSLPRQKEGGRPGRGTFGSRLVSSLTHGSLSLSLSLSLVADHQKGGRGTFGCAKNKRGGRVRKFQTKSQIKNRFRLFLYINTHTKYAITIIIIIIISYIIYKKGQFNQYLEFTISTKAQENIKSRKV